MDVRRPQTGRQPSNRISEGCKQPAGAASIYVSSEPIFNYSQEVKGAMPQNDVQLWSPGVTSSRQHLVARLPDEKADFGLTEVWLHERFSMLPPQT